MTDSSECKCRCNNIPFLTNNTLGKTQTGFCVDTSQVNIVDGSFRTDEGDGTCNDHIFGFVTFPLTYCVNWEPIDRRNGLDVGVDPRCTLDIITYHFIGDPTTPYLTQTGIPLQVSAGLNPLMKGAFSLIVTGVDCNINNCYTINAYVVCRSEALPGDSQGCNQYLESANFCISSIDVASPGLDDSLEMFEEIFSSVIPQVISGSGYDISNDYPDGYDLPTDPFRD